MPVEALTSGVGSGGRDVEAIENHLSWTRLTICLRLDEGLP